MNREYDALGDLDLPRLNGDVYGVASAAPGEQSLFTIGDLAREFGVTLRALRFYEDKGLISPQREGLTRLYSRSDRARLALILKGKRLGFTLAEVKAMVAMHEGGGDSGTLKLSRDKTIEQIAVLEKQKAEIEQAIAELKASLGKVDDGVAAGR